MNDPFAPAANDAPADPWATTTDTPAPPTTQEAPVSVQPENEVSVTFKQHGGFDSPWIVVRGATPALVKEQLRELYGVELIEAVAQTAVKFAATKPAGASAAQQGG